MRCGRAEPRPVAPTGGRREGLEDLWSAYGNHGPEATTQDHGFVQGFPERGSDERGPYRPTEECLAAVDAALGVASDPPLD